MTASFLSPMCSKNEKEGPEMTSFFNNKLLIADTFPINNKHFDRHPIMDSHLCDAFTQQAQALHLCQTDWHIFIAKPIYSRFINGLSFVE